MLSLIGQIGGIELLAAMLGLAIVLVFSFSLHEFAHAFVAYKMGDPTPKTYGRLSINPLKHMDPIGFICCFLFGFGWAKPVPINPINFRKYKKSVVLVSLAGIITNFILAFVGCAFYLICIKYITTYNFFTVFVVYLFMFMFTINISLAVFNLLPIYPLDGFRVVETLTKYNNKYVEFMRRYGMYVMLVILLFGGYFLSYLIDYISYPILAFWRLIIRV